MDRVTRTTNAFVAALAEVIRARREEAGVSQAEVAARAGLSQPYIGIIERGRRCPTVDSLKRVATALGTTATELVRLAEDPAGP